MTKPWKISGDDLVQWAARSEAAHTLPKLIRRLLSATVTLDRIDMRADAGVRLGGWDGIVVARMATAFCPKGRSGWELSVDARPKKKLDKDFDNRTKAPGAGIIPQETTYIAVTARRFPPKLDWAAEKKALGIWADVRVYDADNLAHWLEQAPAVAQWFAGERGLPVTGCRDVETFLKRVQRRTDPPLPIEQLVLAGKAREQAAESFRGWLSDPEPQPLSLWADNVEEAVVFAVAAIAAAPERDEEKWSSRALIVENQEAFQWATSLMHSVEPLIVLALFDGANAEGVGTRAHVVVPREGRPPEMAKGIALDPIPYRQVAEVLKHAGFPEREADRLAQESRGKLKALQRLCGDVDAPAWAKDKPREALVAMLLAGSFEQGNVADADVLRSLGANAEDVERLCGDLQRGPDAAIERHQDWGRRVTLQWRSHAEAWKSLAPMLTQTDLRRFEDVVQAVLGKLDTRYAGPKELRFVIGAGQSRHSPELFQSLAVSIVRFSLSDEILRATLGPSTGSRLAAMLIRRLLRPEWMSWASLSGALPTLAEAAPEIFLEALGDSLDLGNDGVAHLFEEEDLDAPHTGLLWALERLAWLPSLLPQVAILLARLAERDPGGKLANRPIGSLASILHLRFPYSASSISERLSVLALLLRDIPNIGWSIGIGMCGAYRQAFAMPQQRPQYRQWPSPGREPTQSDVYEQLSGAAELLLANARTEPSRWVDFIETATALPDDLRAKVIASLETLAPSLGETTTTVSIRAVIRNVLHWFYRRQRLHGAKEPPTAGERASGIPEWIISLDRIYTILEPTEPIARFAWLFAGGIELPERIDGGWQEELRRRDELCTEAVEHILARDDGWKVLADLAQAADAPAIVGRALANSSFVDEVERRFRDGVVEGIPAPSVQEFFSTRQAAKDSFWREEIFRDLLSKGRVEDACTVAIAMPPTPELWDLLDSIGPPLRERYWNNVPGIWKHIPLQHDRRVDEWQRAIRNFLEVEREPAALNAAGEAASVLPTATILEVLDRFRQAQHRAEPASGVAGLMFSSYVEHLFDALDRDPNVDRAKATELEIFFLPALKNSLRPLRHIEAALDAMSPQNFLALVGTLYRRDGETPSEQALPDEHDVAAVHDLLTNWNGYPGQDLPSEERETRLLDWARCVLDLAKEKGLSVGAQYEVAKVLSRAHPAPDDGLWPCRAARELIHSGKYRHLRDGLHSAKYNQRGVTTRSAGEGGQQERELASRYHTSAERLRGRWPETAALLDTLASTYEEEAQEQDETARAVRSREGLDIIGSSPEQLSPSAQSSSAPEAVIVPDAAMDDRIAEVRIRGLRCIDDLRLPLNGLNVLIGENGSGKSTILEACALLHRARSESFIHDLQAIHLGLPNLLRHGSKEIRLGVRVENRRNIAPPVEYEIALQPGTQGLALIGEERLSAGPGELLLERTAIGTFLHGNGRIGIDPNRTALSQPIAHPALDRVRAALWRIEVHLPFDVTASWATRAHNRKRSLRDMAEVLPAQRLERFGANLASVLLDLQNTFGPAHWEETLEYIRLGLGDEVEGIPLVPAPGGLISFAMKLRGHDDFVPASSLADGVLAYLAHVALFRLHEGASLIAFDEPELHLHPKLLMRVLGFFEAAARTVPVLLATHSDRLLDGLQNAAESVALCELDPNKALHIRRPDQPALTDWLEDYSGLGTIRSEGYLEAVMKDREVA